MKLTASMMLTVDGVYQGPGWPELQVHGSGELLGDGVRLFRARGQMHNLELV